MSERAISEATDRAVPLGTDMLPVAASGSQTAYYVTLGNLIASLPSGTVTKRGVVQLCAVDQVKEVSEANRVVTPAGLADSVNAKMLAPGWYYLGRINVYSLTKSLIDKAFLDTVGRMQVAGELVTVEDKYDRVHVLVYWDGGTRSGWFGMQLDTWMADTGRFKSFS
ncbi:MAG: hypothetical protein IBX69_13115 [Anaerolineales bacterium]|nr:hypothetical protein [Anaerolineales bacterium]